MPEPMSNGPSTHAFSRMIAGARREAVTSDYRMPMGISLPGTGAVMTFFSRM